MNIPQRASTGYYLRAEPVDNSASTMSVQTPASQGESASASGVNRANSVLDSGQDGLPGSSPDGAGNSPEAGNRFSTNWLMRNAIVAIASGPALMIVVLVRDLQTLTKVLVAVWIAAVGISCGISIVVTRAHPDRAPRDWLSYALPFVWLVKQVRHFGGLTKAMRK